MFSKLCTSQSNTLVLIVTGMSLYVANVVLKTKLIKAVRISNTCKSHLEYSVSSSLSIDHSVLLD